MSLVHLGPYAAVLAVAFGTGVFAQAAGQSQSQASQSSSEQRITVTGCVVREADYRKAQDAGRGGVAGTGVGAGNEFVLTSASMSSGASGSAGAGAPSPSSSSGTGTAYELTGSNEGQAAQHVGRRVEITGTLKVAETTASGAPTGGPTAGKPPSGVDVASKDLQLREIEVLSIKEVGTTCPAS